MPVRRLFSSLLAENDLGQGWRVLDWDTEQGPTLTLASGDKQLLIELGPRSERPAYTRTRRFNVYVRDPFAPERRFGDFEHDLLARIVRTLSQNERRLPVIERPPATARAIVRTRDVTRVLMRESADQYYLNPYAGCLIGCPFCFVDEQADLSRALEGAPRQAWGRWLDVKINAAEVLREEVKKLPPGIVRMSPILTDPYQPIERRYRITRSCLEVLLEAGFAPVILTRAARVLDDLELLKKFPRALVGLSIPTDDDRVRKLFEPGADPIEKRIEALFALSAAGIRTFAVIQPMLPMNAERLVEKIAPAIRVVRIDRLYFGESVRDVYVANGFAEMTTDAWNDASQRALTEGFLRRGVRVEEFTRLASLLQ